MPLGVGFLHLLDLLARNKRDETTRRKMLYRFKLIVSKNVLTENKSTSQQFVTTVAQQLEHEIGVGATRQQDR